jgi:hypothetical protein
MGVEVMDRDGPEMAARLDTRPLLALGVLVLLIGAYEMRKHVPKQPHSRSAVVHAADDLEIGRHRHDGTQPTADRVRPGHRKTVTWDARL